MAPSYPADGLRATAAALLRAAGMQGEHARDVADILVEGDLLGHSTHGCGWMRNRDLNLL